MTTQSSGPQIIGLVTPEVFFDGNFKLQDEIALCDILEIRYDLFENLSEWKYIAPAVRASFSDKEIIGTIRLESDGGAFDNGFVEKRNTILYELMLLGKWDWVDIEYENMNIIPSFIKEARNTETKIITSHHNFNAAYSREEYIAKSMKMTGAGSDAIKFSVMVSTEEELKSLYRFVEENENRELKLPLFSVFSMGEFAQSTRVKMPTLGAPCTYGFFGENQPVSGQISVKTLYQKLKNG
ncbi:MAG: type I 3-dehydroquinate dehydratase [Fibrobacterales bacterium]